MAETQTTAAPVFPAYAAANILVSGFTRTQPSGVRRSEFESGARQQMRVARRVLVAETLVIQLSNTDYQSFKAWLNEEIDLVNWFDYTPPGQSATVKARVVNGEVQQERPLDGSLSQWQVRLTVEYWSDYGADH